MGKDGMKLEDVQMIMSANPDAKEQAVLAKQADALLGYFMDQGPRMQVADPASRWAGRACTI